MGVKDTANLAMIPAAYAEDKVYSVLPSDGDGDFTFTRSGSGTRINKGGYIETMGNNVPRLNYRLDADGNPTECAELLLEESRTNQFTNSENLSNIDYQNFTTITPNNTIAPSGSLTADKTTQTNGGYLRETVSVSNGTTYSFSVFLKKGDLRYAVVRSLFSINGVTPANSNCIFDLDNGSVVYKGTDVVSASIEAYPNNWYRCSFVSVASATNSAPFIDFYFSSSSSNSQSAGIAGFAYGWGMQFEAGSTVSSYIPTGASQVTRNKDSAYNQPFGDLASDYPITVYWKGKVDDINTSQSIFSIYKNGSAVDYLTFRWANAGFIQVERRRTTQDVDSETYFANIGDVKKVAIKFTSATSYKLYIDGIEIRNESSGTSLSWDFDSVFIGSLRVVSDTGKRNSSDELFVWNKALTDAEMVEVTSYDTFAEMATGQQFTIQ